MGHYCRRFQEAMLPHVPQDLPLPELQALVILRNGVPPQIRRYVIAPTLEWTVGDMIDSILEAKIIAHMAQADAYMDQYQVPVDDAGQGDPMYEPGPMFPEDQIPAVPEQEIPAAEAEGHMGAEDADDDVVVLIDIPDDPPVIIIPSDDEDEEVDAEPEAGQGDGVIDIDDDFEDDPEEVLFHDGDWDPDSDADSNVSVYTLEVIV